MKSEQREFISAICNEWVPELALPVAFLFSPLFSFSQNLAQVFSGLLQPGEEDKEEEALRISFGLS